MTERVTLILGEDRIEVSRRDLISKSDYFASLFSPNFEDSQRSEHRIKHDIDINTLQTFVAWVSDHKAFTAGNGHRIKPTLAKYVTDLANFDGLMKQLRLSVLFVVETLVEDLTNLIACHWLFPRKSVQIWLVARDLGLATLRDLAKDTSVNHLSEVPESALLDLPGDDFIELVGNSCVQISHEFPLKLVNHWVQRNVGSGKINTFGSRYPFTLLDKTGFDYVRFQEIYQDQSLKFNIQCIVGHKQTPENETRKCIYGWDGTTFSEIVELNSCPIWKDNLVGFQIVGQGFDIYLTGGEYGETANFQTEIWRFSMITKSWHFVTRIPKPRRNMATGFVKGKLILAGGDGPDATDLNSVDLYDISTGEWTAARNSPVNITSESLMYHNQESITFYNIDRNYELTYDSEKNSWANENSSCACATLYFHYNHPEADELDMDELEEYKEYVCPKFLMNIDNSLYVIGTTCPMDLFSVIFKFYGPEVGRLEFLRYCSLKFDNQINNGSCLVGFSLVNQTISVEFVKIENDESIKSEIVYKQKRSDIRDLCPKDRIDCFNVFNPSRLNKVFTF